MTTATTMMFADSVFSDDLLVGRLRRRPSPDWSSDDERARQPKDTATAAMTV
jgi:hypothetical protein